MTEKEIDKILNVKPLKEIPAKEWNKRKEPEGICLTPRIDKQTNKRPLTKEEFHQLVRKLELDTGLTVPEILSRIEFYFQSQIQRIKKNEK